MSSTQTLVQDPEIPVLIPTSPTHVQLQVSNIYQVVHGTSKRPATDCYGYIIDANHRFTVSPQHPEPELCSAVTLGQVLAGKAPGLVALGYSEKLKISVVSINVLHLHTTPWLAKVEPATLLPGRIMESGGGNHWDAVNWCLRSVFRIQGLSDGTFCQSYYEAVVAQLEEDTKYL
ncbi:hypothetical protein QBC33DRAFT_212175 [Phialemonium atrogriseum]|uniref:Uncharacterized protein n=1 Tax=Phialemonium atrogriseum TaxID=1093897 RepID=A0AAJ0BVJ4_9PEZI|nr:uncharacterized protein QBC33DRAFT_212175 [Phialemonium atrogriseum]KAK1763822.1 hypothetical protein QBC33DRAFT_212175 [Phialemonium atrogriseum]